MTTPFADALRAAIDARGVSLVWLRDRLADLDNPVSVAALSYWRSGRRRPDSGESLAAVRAIETVLDLPPDATVPDIRFRPAPRT